MDLDTAAGKETRQPKTVAPSLMGQYHPGDLATHRRAPGLETLEQTNQPVATSVQHVPRMPANARQLNRQNPLLLTNKKLNDSGGGWVRCCCWVAAYFCEVWIFMPRRQEVGVRP